LAAFFSFALAFFKAFFSFFAGSGVVVRVDTGASFGCVVSSPTAAGFFFFFLD